MTNEQDANGPIMLPVIIAKLELRDNDILVIQDKWTAEEAAEVEARLHHHLASRGVQVMCLPASAELTVLCPGVGGTD